MSSVETLEKRVAELEDSLKRYLYLSIVGIIAAIVFAVMLWMVPSRNDMSIIGKVLLLEVRLNKLDPASANVSAMGATTPAPVATAAP